MAVIWGVIRWIELLLDISSRVVLLSTSNVETGGEVVEAECSDEVGAVSLLSTPYRPPAPFETLSPIVGHFGPHLVRAA